MIPRLLDRLERARREFGWKELCHDLLAPATVLRWRARARAGQPVVAKAGPRKPPFDPAVLQAQIRQLDHGRRRTAGAGALHARWAEVVSRRDFQDLVAEERQHRVHQMTRLEWLHPGAAWGLDTTDYQDQKITPLRDLASRYQLSPLVQPTEDGARIAVHLDTLFRQHGPPLFLKRDLGSPLNCQAVDEVLEAHRVLPLNSPPGYPRYNGAIERGMRDLKAALDQRRADPGPAISLAVQVELATHQLNHQPRRCLDGRTPCQVYHDPARRLRLHGAVRRQIFREIFDQYWHCVEAMPERTSHTLRAAWRWIVQAWLRRQGWINVRVNHQQIVSTIYPSFSSHN